jgi:hypothetical protein
VPQAQTDALLALNAEARLAGLRAALFVVLLSACLALFFTNWVPVKQPGAAPEEEGMVPDPPATLPRAPNGLATN